MTGRFLQIHTLTPYAAALLNRDDAGFAKRLPLGGVTRTRISSQCLKRHWRTHDGEDSLEALDLPETIRSRRTFEHEIIEPLVAGGGDAARLRAVTEAVMHVVLGESAKAKETGKAKKEEEGSNGSQLHTSQVTVLGQPELHYLRDLIDTLSKDLSGESESLAKDAAALVKKAFDKDVKANLREMVMAGGLGAALFGRMVTSDILARCDSAIHVAHSFTVHEQDSEDDYFSAMDDLVEEAGEQGSGHINSSELTSGLYYGYVVVDLPLLVSNLTGCDRKDWLTADRTTAAELVSRLIALISTVSPGAKLGSTAPYSYADFVMLEHGSQQPCNLAKAFVEPVSASGNVRAETFARLDEELADRDRMYPSTGQRAFAGIRGSERLRERAEPKESVAELREWAKQRVLDGGA